MTSNSSPDRSPEETRAEEEALAWVVLLTSGDSTAADHHRFQGWRDASPRHAEALARARRLWSQLEIALPTIEQERLAQNVDQELGSDHAGQRSRFPARSRPLIRGMRAAALSRPSQQRGFRWNSWRPLAVAASLALVIGGGTWIHNGGAGWMGGGPQEQIANWSPETRTALGQIASIALADGSRVTLNTDSALRTAIFSTGRQVRLDRGEAYFQVAKDKTRPFTVAAGKITATAIGTAFSMRQYDDAVIVTLAEGKLRVATADSHETAILSPGDQLRSDKAGFHLIRVDARQATSWTSGMLDFDRVPLATVVNEFNRYRQRQIVLGDRRLANLPVTGLFPINQPDRFVDMLVTANQARIVRKTDKAIELTSR